MRHLSAECGVRNWGFQSDPNQSWITPDQAPMSDSARQGCWPFDRIEPRCCSAQYECIRVDATGCDVFLCRNCGVPGGFLGWPSATRRYSRMQFCATRESGPPVQLRQAGSNQNRPKVQARPTGSDQIQPPPGSKGVANAVKPSGTDSPNETLH